MVHIEKGEREKGKRLFVMKIRSSDFHLSKPTNLISDQQLRMNPMEINGGEIKGRKEKLERWKTKYFGQEEPYFLFFANLRSTSEDESNGDQRCRRIKRKKNKVGIERSN